MKYAFSFIIFFVALGLQGQTVSTETWSQKKTSIDYAVHRPDSVAKEILFGFYDDADSTWKKESWAQELTWLASERGAMVVVPDQRFNSLDSTAVDAFIRSVSEPDSITSIRFVSLGTGVRSIHGLFPIEAGGVIIAPSDSISSESVKRNLVAGLIDSRKGDSTMRVSNDLHEAGAWVFQKMVIGKHPYYFDGHRSAISYMMNQIDSMSLLLSDSAFMASLKTKVLEAGPDVLRQGRPFETSLMVAKQGEFQVNVLNLSAEVVWRTLTFLGKGKHVIEIPTKDLPWGVYKIEIDGPSFLAKQKLMIRG